MTTKPPPHPFRVLEKPLPWCTCESLTLGVHTSWCLDAKDEADNAESERIKAERARAREGYVDELSKLEQK